MSTQVLQPISFVRRLGGGGGPVIEEYPEAASQTFKKGEMVYLDGSGHVAEFTASVDDGSTRFLGFAAEDGHNDTAAATHKVKVMLPTDDSVFEGNIYHSTAASAITALTDVASGTLLPFVQLPSQGDGMVAVDKENTSGQIDCIRIVNLSPKHAVGDVYGRVEFIVEAAGRLIAR